MDKVARYLLWLFVFTVPWDMVTIRGVGTLSRLTGMLAFGFAALTAVARGRVRRPGGVFWFALAFTLWSSVSVLWSLSPASTLLRMLTSVQLFASFWMVQEFVRTREQHRSLLVAFCLGAVVPMVELFSILARSGFYDMRYTGGAQNGNDLGLTLVLGLPFAWQLIRFERGAARIVGVIYFAVAPVAVLLTGGRGPFMAGLVAMAIIPFTMSFRSLRSHVQIVTAAVVLVVGALFLVPQGIWNRISTINEELLGGGSLGGRRAIWQAGWEALPEHPILGVGAAAFPAAVYPSLGVGQVAHNLPLTVLVEQGVVGFVIFASLLMASARTIRGMPRPERRLWMVIGLAWCVGVMGSPWEYSKVTWLFLGLIAALGHERHREARVAGMSAGRPATARPIPAGYASTLALRGRGSQQ